MTYQNHKLFSDSYLQAILPTLPALPEWSQVALDTGLKEELLHSSESPTERYLIKLIFKDTFNYFNHNVEIQLARHILDDPILRLRGKAKMGYHESERRTGG